MTDDAELRARIQAQVAARRAGTSSAGVDSDETHEAEPGRDEANGAEPSGPQALAPVRPWARSAHGADAAGRSAARPSRSDATPGGGAPAGLGPVRPWLARRERPADAPPATEPASATDPDPTPHATPTTPAGGGSRTGTGPGGHLEPARPWSGRAAAPPEPPAAPRTPSNPGFVLQELAADVAPAAPASEPAITPPAAIPPALAEPAEPSDGTSDEAPDEQYPWQRPTEIDHDLRGAASWDPAMYPPEQDEPSGRRGRRALKWLLARAPERDVEPVEEPATEAAPDPAPAAELTPAPVTEPEPAGGEIATPAPEAASVPVTEPLPVTEAQPAPLPVTEAQPAPLPVTEAQPAPLPVAEAQPAPLPVAEAEPASAELTPAEPEATRVPVAEPEPAAPGQDLARRLAAAHSAEADPADHLSGSDPDAEHRSVLSRLFGRRQSDEAVDEVEEEFTLPEPDAAFERPWLRTDPLPQPTRSWPSPKPASDPDGASEVAAVTEPAQPLPEPVALAEPVAAVEPLTVPEPVVVSEPVAAAEPVPAEPEPAAAATPFKTAALAASEPAESEPAPRRRPSPGTRHLAAPDPGPSDPGPSVAEPPAPAPVPPSRPAPRPRPAATVSTPAATAPGGISGATRDAEPHRPAHAAASGTISGAGYDSYGATATQTGPDLSRLLALDAATRAAEADEQDDTDDDSGAPRQGRRWQRVLIRSFIIVVIAALAAFLLRAFVVQPYYIPSASMEPTLHGCPGCNDDHVLVDKISYRAGRSVHAGDIVVFNRPTTWTVSDSVLIKRVIGLPGDRISMTKGQVFVNGLELDEPYLNQDRTCYATSANENFKARTVPDGDVYVMGDNRCDSEDSRVFGPVPKSDIIGRAFAIIWPLSRIRSL